MMKVKVWLCMLTGIVAATMMTGCKNGKNSAGNPVELKFNVANADQYEYKQDIDLDLNMSGISTQQKTAMTFRYVAAPAPATDKQLTLNYTQFSTDMKTMGGGASYNSETEKDTALDLSKHPLTFPVSPKGVIGKIEGLEFLQDKMLIDANVQNAQMMSLLSSIFTEPTMRGLLQPVFTIYPDKPVRNGDTWSTETSLNITTISLKLTTTYKLEKVTNGIAHVIITSKISSSEGVLNAGGIDVKVDVKGDGKGTMDVDVASGALTESNLDLNATGTMSAGPVKAPVNMTMNSKAKGRKI